MSENIYKENVQNTLLSLIQNLCAVIHTTKDKCGIICLYVDVIH